VIPKASLVKSVHTCALIALTAAVLAGCGTGSVGEGAQATDAVRATGTDVSGCVPAWSGYGGEYDDTAYKDAAVAQARWRCKLTTAVNGEEDWCFTWTDGEDAQSLRFPASLEVSGKKSC